MRSHLVQAAAISVITTVVATVAAATVAAAAADIVAAVLVCAIVTAAQGNVNSRHGSGLQSIAMDAAIVTDLCNFGQYLH